ncbi:MAG: hypothetical protein ACJAZT_001257 [Gammaproteobacteria bacterium]|jgi:hypothetical protein
MPRYSAIAHLSWASLRFPAQRAIERLFDTLVLFCDLDDHATELYPEE